MASSSHLFEEKAPSAVGPNDRVVAIPGPRAPEGVVVVARQEAIALVDYLISLNRQYPVPAPGAAGGANGAH